MNLILLFYLIKYIFLCIELLIIDHKDRYFLLRIYTLKVDDIILEKTNKTHKSSYIPFFSVICTLLHSHSLPYPPFRFFASITHVRSHPHLIPISHSLYIYTISIRIRRLRRLMWKTSFRHVSCFLSVIQSYKWISRLSRIWGSFDFFTEIFNFKHHQHLKEEWWRTPCLYCSSSSSSPLFHLSPYNQKINPSLY